MAVKLSIDMEVDYLLMIDSDMSPDLPIRGNKDFWPTCWNLMYQRRVAEIKEIGEDVRTPAYEAASVAGRLHGPFGPFAPATIAAPYCGPPPHEMPYIFRWVNYESDTPNANYGLKMFERDQAALMTGVQQVGALPTGLILYDVRLFKALPTPWFYYEWSDKYCLKKASTEDVVQTRNASLAGFPSLFTGTAGLVTSSRRLSANPRSQLWSRCNPHSPMLCAWAWIPPSALSRSAPSQS